MSRNVSWRFCVVPAVAIFCVGCNDRPEQADPEAIRQFEELEKRGAAGTAVASGSATPAPTAERRGGEGPDVAEFGARLVAQAVAILEKTPIEIDAARRFAYASWHLDRTDKGRTADVMFDRAKRCVESSEDPRRRQFGTSHLIAACRGGGHDSELPALVIDSDRNFDAMARGASSLEEAELEAAAEYRLFFRAMILAGRTDQAMLRLSALKSPVTRYLLAEVMVRQLAARDRRSNVLHCAEVMRQASEMQPALKDPPRRRGLVSAYALADNREAAEKIFQTLPAPTDEGGSVRSTTKWEWKFFGAASSTKIEGRTYSAAQYRSVVDLAAARRRGGDVDGCIRLIDSEFERLRKLDLPACITAWVECDEYERAAELVRREPDPTLKPRYAALLCLATAERGDGGIARRLAAEFERFPYTRDSEPTSAASLFDTRTAGTGLIGVVPLLTGNEPAYFDRIRPLDDAERCETLLRSASLLWELGHARATTFVPYQEDSIARRVFEEPYWRYTVNDRPVTPEGRP